MCAFLQAELGAAGTSDVLAHNVPGFDDAAELVGDNKNNVRSEMMPTCAAHAPHMRRTCTAHAPHTRRTCTAHAPHLHICMCMCMCMYRTYAGPAGAQRDGGFDG